MRLSSEVQPDALRPMAVHLDLGDPRCPRKPFGRARAVYDFTRGNIIFIHYASDTHPRATGRYNRVGRYEIRRSFILAATTTIEMTICRESSFRAFRPKSPDRIDPALTVTDVRACDSRANNSPRIDSTASDRGSPVTIHRDVFIMRVRD